MYIRWLYFVLMVFCIDGIFFFMFIFLSRDKLFELLRDVYLLNVNCLGVEDLVIVCEGFGWRNVNWFFCNYENDVGVYCYKSGKWMNWWMDRWIDGVYIVYDYISLYFIIYIIKIYSLYNVGVLLEECYDGNCRGLLEVFLDNIVC